MRAVKEDVYNMLLFLRDSTSLYFPVDFGGPGGSLTYPIPGWRKCEVSALRVLKQVYQSVETAQDNSLLRDKLWEGFENRKA